MGDREEMSRAMIPAMHRIKMMLARAVVSLVNDSLKMQELQLAILHEEKKDGVEHFQNYGFTSHPKAPDASGAAEAVVVFLGGNRDHGIVIVVDDRRFRLKGLESGEVAIYDDLGQKIVLKRDKIEVTSPTRVDILAPDIKLDAATKVEVIAPSVTVLSDDVSLGGEGGAKVARVGDSTSDGATITSGSDKVTAA